MAEKVLEAFGFNALAEESMQQGLEQSILTVSYFGGVQGKVGVVRMLC